MELYVTVVVPKNQLALCCRRHPDYSKSGDRYKLDQRDPEYLNQLIHLIHSASDNQIVVNMDKPANRKCKAALDAYNQAHPGQELSQADLVRHISRQDYKHSVVSTKNDVDVNKHSAYGEELHVFKHVKVPGFADTYDTSLYIKIVDPDGAYPIQVYSLHRDDD